MVTVTVVELGISGWAFFAHKAKDGSSYEAESIAKQLKAQGVSFTEAFVDRFDGLVLCGRDESWHFRCALCGYEGTGVHATATILEMFGFGERRALFLAINTGGDTASFSFSRP